MTKVEVHPDTASMLRIFAELLPQSLLLTGREGAGLLTAAKYIAGKNLATIIQPTDIAGELSPEGAGEIRVKQIRELLVQTRGKSTTPQIFIIDNADQMNQVAQNAFLKLLEEPTENIHFILTSHNTQNLLPTILSRVQSMPIRPISSAQSLKLMQQDKLDERTKQQILFLAEGRPAEIMRLVSSKSYRESRTQAITDARQFLSGPIKDRIHIAAKYHSNRSGALDMLALAIRIIEATLSNQPTAKLITTAQELSELYESIALHGNVRLLLLSFVVK